MSKPPHNMLFGYSVDNLCHILSPPPFVSGPSLLDDTDMRFLDSFFDGVSSDQYLVNDQYDTWSYEWQDLPPDFLGTTSSFGHQIEPVTNDVLCPTFPEFKNSLEFLLHRLSPPEDVIAAAPLLRNGHTNNNNRYQTHPNGYYNNTFMVPTSSCPQHMSPPFNQHSSQQRKISTRPKDYIGHTSMSEAIYGGALYAPSATFRAHTQKEIDIKWGSDSGFNTGRHFVAPPNTKTQDEIDEHIASTLAFLQPGSNTSTCPSSPTEAKHPNAYLDRMLEMTFEGATDDIDDGGEGPKKRKKNKGKERVYESDVLDQQLQTSNSVAKLPRKRRPRSFNAAGESQQTRPSPSLHKRRKPRLVTSSVTPKRARKNLTENQKRENHIKSEHKRRTIIKKGFEDLNELVPGLRGGGPLSKSVVLTIAADWLEDLLRRNEGFRVLIVELEG